MLTFSDSLFVIHYWVDFSIFSSLQFPGIFEFGAFNIFDISCCLVSCCKVGIATGGCFSIATIVAFWTTIVQSSSTLAFASFPEVLAERFFYKKGSKILESGFSRNSRKKPEMWRKLTICCSSKLFAVYIPFEFVEFVLLHLVSQ